MIFCVAGVARSIPRAFDDVDRLANGIRHRVVLQAARSSASRHEWRSFEQLRDVPILYAHARCVDPASGRELYGLGANEDRFQSNAGGYFRALNPHPHRRDLDFNAVRRRLEWRSTAYRAEGHHSNSNVRNAIRKRPRSFLPRIAGVA